MSEPAAPVGEFAARLIACLDQETHHGLSQGTTGRSVARHPHHAGNHRTAWRPGTRPWIKPWRGVPISRPLRACGIPYRGMNVFWLWMVADMCGYASPFWMTYKQAKALGAQVRKGEKATIAIFYKSYTKEVEAPDTGEKSDEARRVQKAYPVFNADQVEGLAERFHPAATLELVEPEGP